MFWTWSICKQWFCKAKWLCRVDFAEQSDSAEQLSKSSYFFCLCDWILKRRKNLQRRWKRRRKSKNKKWMNEQKKKRKMKNEMKRTMIFYLTKRSIFSSFFHFVIFALAFMSSLNESISNLFNISRQEIDIKRSFIDTIFLSKKFQNQLTHH